MGIDGPRAELLNLLVARCLITNAREYFAIACELDEIMQRYLVGALHERRRAILDRALDKAAQLERVAFGVARGEIAFRGAPPLNEIV